MDFVEVEEVDAGVACTAVMTDE